MRMVIRGDVKCKKRSANCEVRDEIAIATANVDAMPYCTRLPPSLYLLPRPPTSVPPSQLGDIRMATLLGVLRIVHGDVRMVTQLGFG